jgi:hypothetical protein
MNYYELDLEEKSKYRRKFNETPFVKRNNKTRVPTLIIAGISYFLIGVLEGMMSEGVVIDELVTSGAELVFIISFVEFIILTIINELGFVRWLKIKNKIDI